MKGKIDSNVSTTLEAKKQLIINSFMRLASNQSCKTLPALNKTFMVLSEHALLLMVEEIVALNVSCICFEYVLVLQSAAQNISMLYYARVKMVLE